MKFEELENKGLIRRIKVNLKQIHNFLSRSKQDLETAKFNLTIDEAWSYAIAYHAMFRAGRSLIMSYGFRTIGKDQHATVVRFTNIVLGNEYKDLINMFDRMRRKRHDFIYEPNRPIPRQEANQAIADAEKLVKQIEHVVKKKDPQKDLKADY
ncbi:MAG: HEPN domain-containing protein [Candidatus Aminicenantes bacterium]|nr:HEPN domain-containing protein [Candidatus Aminicenantes bacterium]